MVHSYGGFNADEQNDQSDQSLLGEEPCTPPLTQQPRQYSRFRGLVRSAAALAVVGAVYMSVSSGETEGTDISGMATATVASASVSASDSASASASTGDSTGGSTRAPSNVAPNILLLMMDQARPDAFLSEDHSTPNVDRIATEGANFVKAYSSTPMCTPARTAILTGKSPWGHGMRGYADAIAPAHRMEMDNAHVIQWVQLPMILRDAGYYTVSVGKNHFGYNSSSLSWNDNAYAHGFAQAWTAEAQLKADLRSSEFVSLDDYGAFFNESCPHCEPLLGPPSQDLNSWWGSPYQYEEELHPTSWIGTHAVKFLREWGSGDHEASGHYDNFFLKVSFRNPHSPYDPPSRVYDKVLQADGDKLKPYYAEDGWDSSWTGPTTLCNMSNLDTYCGTPDSTDLKSTRAAYLASVYFIDEWVGKIHDELELNRLDNNTFILFIADHGDSIGDHHLWRKGFYTDQVATVPLMMRWPHSMDGIIPAERGTVISDKIVELRDVLPTLAQVAGIKLNANQQKAIQGSSVLSLLGEDADSVEWREWIDIEMALCDMSDEMNYNALTDGKMKYVHSLYDGSERLFNMTDDPREKADVSAIVGYQDEIIKWRQRMFHQFVAEGRGKMFTQINNVTGEETLAFSSDVSCKETKIMQNYPCFPGICSESD